MFIKLHKSGKQILVNPDQIAAVTPPFPIDFNPDDRAIISFQRSNNDFIVVDEPYEEVEKLLEDLHYVH